MKTALSIILFWGLTLNTSAQESLQGYINDTDGYTNIRENSNIESKIIGKILEGKIFTFFIDKDSNWWKVKTKNKLVGYVHKSRIKSVQELTVEITKFLNKFSGLDPNNVEFSEVGNEDMFNYVQKFPLAFINALSSLNVKDRKHIATELETPIHDMIDLELIFKRIAGVDHDSEAKSLILKSIKIAGSKLGLKIGE